MALLSEHLTGRGHRAPPRGGTVIARVEGLAFHDLRGANATGMVLDGIDLRTAQTRLEHSDPG